MKAQRREMGDVVYPGKLLWKQEAHVAPYIQCIHCILYSCYFVTALCTSLDDAVQTSAAATALGA